jgi:hypothetical protein
MTVITYDEHELREQQDGMLLVTPDGTSIGFADISEVSDFIDAVTELYIAWQGRGASEKA